MKKFVFTKTFNDTEEMSSFINNHVGDAKYYEIRPQWIYVDGLTMIITMSRSKNLGCRKDICIENGFVMEWREVA